MYYREKIVNLHTKLFLSVGDARKKFIENEDYWLTTYLAAKNTGDKTIIDEWDRIWSELTIKKSPYDRRSDFYHTILSKQNRGLKKYLHFVLEQYTNEIYR